MFSINVVQAGGTQSVVAQYETGRYRIGQYKDRADAFAVMRVGKTVQVFVNRVGLFSLLQPMRFSARGWV